MKEASMEQLQETISTYSKIFHNKYNDEHHIVSPLGAWMLLALLAQGSNDETDPLDPIAKQALGLTVQESGKLLKELLSSDHPAVFSALKAWLAPGVTSTDGSLKTWRQEVENYCPIDVKIPTADELNSWVQDKSLNLIQEFPVSIDPSWFKGLFATVVATDVEWEVPMKVIQDKALSKHWDKPDFLLDSDSNHTFIHRDSEHGLFGVHYAKAKKGLTVYSVISFSDAPENITLEVAHKIGSGEYNKVSLADLESNEFLTIKEVNSYDGVREKFQSILPAWEFSGKHNLNDIPECGLSTAAGRLGEVGEVKQVVVADYSDKGFKAAALTYAMVGRAAVFTPTNKALHADLQFTKPYAVVAFATDDNTESIWNNLPVFSGVVAEAKII
jgi:hypothetical protein